MKNFLLCLLTVAGLLLAANSANARFRSVVKVKTVGVNHVGVVGINHAYGFGFGSGFGYHRANSVFLLPRATAIYGYGSVVGLGMGYGGCSQPAPTPTPAPTPAPVPPPQPLPPPSVQAPVADPVPVVQAPVMNCTAPVALGQSYAVRRLAVVNPYIPTVALRRVRVAHAAVVATPIVAVNAVATPAVVKQKTVTRGGFRRVKTKTVTRVR